MGSEPNSNVLIYLLRRDLRVADNPILNHLATNKHDFTHLLPVYLFSAKQVEVSGFLRDGQTNPYPAAKSRVGGFWRCGPHRAKFLSEAVWDLKQGLEKVGSSLHVQVGMAGEITEKLTKELENASQLKVGAIWMTEEFSFEEVEEQNDVKGACEKVGADFKLWQDEKYLIDDRDIKHEDPKRLPDVFTTYRKEMEPLRDQPRDVLPSPEKDSLPPFPSVTLTEDVSPFLIPDDLDGLLKAMMKPISTASLLENPTEHPPDAETVHPFLGGEKHAHDRLHHLLETGLVATYKKTRNGMLGVDFSAKVSAFLAIGCITARQIHAGMLGYEDGTTSVYESAEGYGKGENEGTKAMRFELLWRDYMRLCTRKFGVRLYHLGGFKQRADAHTKWSTPDNPNDGRSREELSDALDRFLNGTTGMGLIDASQREMFHTGYTSNRARQNVASFLSKHLYLDWRIGAEWYESMLVDYDVSSNWGNWQYVAGVGNDPRDDHRVFNPVKQSFDYDPRGDYVKTWVSEVRGLEDPGEVFQCWTVPAEEREAKGLAGLPMCESPLKKIDFTVGRRAAQPRGGRGYQGRGGWNGRGRRGRGNGGGGGGWGDGGYQGGRGGGDYQGGRGGGDYQGGRGGGDHQGGRGGGEYQGGRGGGDYAPWQSQDRGGYGGRGYGSSRGHLMAQQGTHGYPAHHGYYTNGMAGAYMGNGHGYSAQGHGYGQAFPIRSQGDYQQHIGAVVPSI